MDSSRTRFRHSLVEREEIPEVGKRYDRPRDGGGVDYVIFHDTDTANFRTIGEQKVLVGEIVSKGELVGKLRYRVRSSLLVSKIAPDPSFSTIAGTTAICPLEHFGMGVSRQGAWMMLERADEVHSAEYIPLDGCHEPVELTEYDEQTLAKEYGDHILNKIDMEVDGVRCKWADNHFTVEGDASFDKVQPIFDLYESIRFRKAHHRNRIVREDGELQFVKR